MDGDQGVCKSESADSWEKEEIKVACEDGPRISPFRLYRLIFFFGK